MISAFESKKCFFNVHYLIRCPARPEIARIWNLRQYLGLARNGKSSQTVTGCHSYHPHLLRASFIDCLFTDGLGWGSELSIFAFWAGTLLRISIRHACRLISKLLWRCRGLFLQIFLELRADSLTCAAQDKRAVWLTKLLLQTNPTKGGSIDITSTRFFCT